MNVRQKPLRKGIGEGLVGVGKIAGLGVLSPWAVLVLLIIIAVAGIIFWAYLHIYHLTTAFAGFIAGLILVWLGSHMIPEENRDFKLLLIPVALAVLGYFCEYLKIWSVPLSYRLSLNAIVFSFDYTISLDTLLLMIIAICFVFEILIELTKKK